MINEDDAIDYFGIIPDEILEIVLTMSIEEGDHVRIVCVSKKWEDAATRLYMRLLPHFLDEARILMMETIPRGNKDMDLEIEGCILMKSYSVARDHRISTLALPFGKIAIGGICVDCQCWIYDKVSTTESRINCRNCITIDEIHGDEDIMVAAIHRILPELHRLNLYRSKECWCATWSSLPGYHSRDDWYRGYKDQLPPDLVDNSDYMTGYNIRHEQHL